jgi:hypothetical protein
MHTHRLLLILINVAGGIAVLGSYAWGFATHPASRDRLWGAVPQGLVPIYTVSMVAAAVGYFLFTSYFLLRIDPDQARLLGRFGFGGIQMLYLGILIPSALWMPMTFAMLSTPSTPLWWAIRLVLAAVGLSSLLLLAMLLGAAPEGPRGHYWPAVIGLAAFCFQTAVLDAIVWPHFFR